MFAAWCGSDTGLQRLEWISLTALRSNVEYRYFGVSVCQTSPGLVHVILRSINSRIASSPSDCASPPEEGLTGTPFP